MDFGKGGRTVRVTCTRGCGCEWDEFVPAGRASIWLCDKCWADLVAAVWAACDDAQT